ncbi:uncharacterized protein SAPINGB_P003033 [Magnusiomyces paraingens]|uniref:Uncharacterized protein n=1 Tax=Magnusiomyces paraingens TaxID=2606893 RepID=A0A5E8BL10_9ASCO|nr:uncharacterized protein SAPINGB_P003033 [Saprochaete ingens]VVT51247.1 unnamed protein product [Saprochaete ingens]
MDGLLIDSEHIYTETINEIAAEHGLPPVPWALRIKMQGRPGPAAAAVILPWLISQRHATSADQQDLDQFLLQLTTEFPYMESPESFFAETTRRQRAKWPGRTQFLPGALPLLERLSSNGTPIALATSTSKPNFKLKTGHLRTTESSKQFDLFPNHLVITGDDPRIPPGRGKPAPDIWLVALDSLNAGRQDPIRPEECLVFEDGLIGVTAAKSAGMNFVWVPQDEVRKALGSETIEAQLLHEENALLSGQVLESLSDFDPEKYNL